MKIELKHLAPYLPYELQLYRASDVWVMHSLGVEEICIANGLHTQTLSFDDCITDYSPMLRPISSLTKEIEHKGEKFVPIDVLWNETLEQVDSNTYDDHFFNSDLETTWICQENVLQLAQIVVDKLLEWHFDVFGLIPAGLATELS